jgi:hypothetical protein
MLHEGPGTVAFTLGKEACVGCLDSFSLQHFTQQSILRDSYQTLGSPTRIFMNPEDHMNEGTSRQPLAMALSSTHC